MSATDVIQRSPFARGDVLLVSNLTALGVDADVEDVSVTVLRVLQVEDMPDGARLTVERLGEEPPAETPAACGTVEASCVCDAVAGHYGPHECECGGAWEVVDGEFRVISLPGSGR